MGDDLEELPPRSLEEYWAIVSRRRWWIFLPFFLCWALVWGVSWLLPTTYRSEAVILVEQQKVPEQYVLPNVTVSLQDRLHSMTQQILSRTRLQATIDRFGLYSKQGGPNALLELGDAVEQMRKDIKIDLVQSPGRPGELTAFKIQYSAGTPVLAQKVNNELTSLFIDENLKYQQEQSESTTAFLKNQLADARVQLEQQEAKVRAFKAKHWGDLPSQLETNVQILTGLQTQLDNNQRSLDAAKQQKLYLESLQQQYRTIRATLGSADSQSPEALDKKLLDLRSRLADARSRYTEDYPEVVDLKEKIQETEKLRKSIDNEIATSQKTDKAKIPAGLGESEDLPDNYSTPMMQVRSQLKANELEIQNFEQHEQDIETQIAAYRARLKLTPQTEQELADVARGYEESKANYNSLFQKQNQSQLATSLEQRQQGEQFRIVDPPSLPDKPSAPNHLRLSLGALVVGMVLGLGLTALLEKLSVRVQREKDLDGLVPARVLARIPHLMTPREDRFRLVFRGIEFGIGVAMVILVVVGNLYAFYKG